jgi:hypothetical protein
MEQQAGPPLPPESLLLGTLQEEEEEGEVELETKKPSFSAIFQPTLRPQGEAFNATRQLIKEGTLVRRATLISASGTPGDAALLSNAQPGRSPTPGMGETCRPAQPIENLLEAMLPSSAFTSQLPASRFGSSPGDPDHAQQQSQTAKHVEGDSGSNGKWANPVPTAASTEDKAEQSEHGASGGVLDPASSEKAPDATVQASHPSTTVLNDAAAHTQGGSIELNGAAVPQPADKQDLTATWQFQEVRLLPTFRPCLHLHMLGSTLACGMPMHQETPDTLHSYGICLLTSTAKPDC